MASSMKAVLLIFVAIPTTLDGSPFNFIADVSPLDVIAHVGERVTINCTLKDAANSNPRWLFFRRLSDSQMHEVPSETHRVLLPDTIQLHLDDVSLDDAGQYFCYMREDGDPLNESFASITTSYVQVGVPPSEPDTFDCVMSNLDSMTCSWCSEPMPEPWVVYTLTWRVRLAVEFDWCKQYGTNRCSCIIDGPAFVPFLVYDFNLTGINDFGRSSKAFQIEANEELVVAGPLEDLEASARSPREIALTWNPPSRLFIPDLTFEVSYTDQQDATRMFVTADTNATLTELTPDTNYTITVRTLVPGSRHVGEPAQVTCRAMPDAKIYDVGNGEPLLLMLVVAAAAACSLTFALAIVIFNFSRRRKAFALDQGSQL